MLEVRMFVNVSRRKFKYLKMSWKNNIESPFAPVEDLVKSH